MIEGRSGGADAVLGQCVGAWCASRVWRVGLVVWVVRDDACRAER